MKSLAPSTHRTGQPRWRQLMLKAMNWFSPTRRSHAAVFAVIPDQGSGEGSVKSTLTVCPIANASTLPTGRQREGAGRTSGASTNPSTGMPANAPIAPAAATVIRVNTRRREISAFSDGEPFTVIATVVCTLVPPVFCDVANPNPEGPGEACEPAGRHHRRRRQAPKRHRDAQGKQERSVGRLRRGVWVRFGPLERTLAGEVEFHDGYSVAR